MTYEIMRAQSFTLRWIGLLALANCSTGTAKAQVEFRDDFNSPNLADGWEFVREDPQAHSLTARPGFLRIRTQRGGLGELSNARNLLLREVTGNFIIETMVEFNPRTARQFAGLLVYEDDSHGVSLGLAYAQGERGDFRGVAVISAKGLGVEPEREGAFYDEDSTDNPNLVFLRMLRSGNQFICAYSRDGIQYVELGSVNNDLPDTLQVGVGAGNGDPVGCGSECDISINADFDFFEVSAIGSSNGNTNGNDNQGGPGTDAELTAISLGGLEIVDAGQTAQFSANALFSDATGSDVTEDAEWSVAPPGVAEIDRGVLTTQTADVTQQLTVVVSYTFESPSGSNTRIASQLVCLRVNGIGCQPVSQPPADNCAAGGGGCGAMAGCVFMLFCWLPIWNRLRLRREPNGNTAFE